MWGENALVNELLARADVVLVNNKVLSEKRESTLVMVINEAIRPNSLI